MFAKNAQSCVREAAIACGGNFRQYKYRACDPSERPTNMLGLSTDYSAVEGTVLLVDHDRDVMVLREGRKAKFAAFQISNLTSVPNVGDKVLVTPYERRHFDGRKFSEPEKTADGVSTIVFGESISRIKNVPENASIYLQQMVKQIEEIRADHRRTIGQVLIDSGAYKHPVRFRDIDADKSDHMLPQVIFHVEVGGAKGTLTITLDRGADDYSIALLLDEQEPEYRDGLFFDDLAKTINELLVKDDSWIKDQVRVIKAAKVSKTA